MVVLPVGSVFASDYQVENVLGQGGMGTVYVARQLSTGQRRALKLLHPFVIGKDPNAHAHFEQEAKVASLIPSAHIVQVVAAGVVDGAPWLAMELLEGETLKALVSRVGRLPIEIVREVIDQLMFALSLAHERGIVHRDLKPENLFVTKATHANTHFTLKILDFGIAVVLQRRLETLQTTPMGTPGWMAPEQMYKGAKIGPYTDVWAIGLITFWLIAGMPYWVSDAQGLSQMSVLKEMDLGVVVNASVRAAQYGCERVLPREFDDWFARCLAREGANRFPHAAAAYEVLAPLLRLVSDSKPAPAGAATRPSPPTAPFSGTAAVPPLQQSPLRATEIASFPVFAATSPPVSMPISMPPGPARPPERSRTPRRIATALGAALGIAAIGWTFASPSDPGRACVTEWARATDESAPRIEASCAKACTSKGGAACAADGEVLVLFPRVVPGESAAGARGRAVDAFEKGCVGGDGRACRRGAELLAETKPSQALQLLERGCASGDLDACAEHGALREEATPRDEPGAAAEYEKACDAHGALGCTYRGFMLATGRGGKRDPAAARALITGASTNLKTACDSGSWAACVAQVSATALLGGAPANAEASLRGACDRGFATGCVNLATAQIFGLAGVKPALGAGIAALQQACDSNVSLACANSALALSGQELNLRYGPGGALTLKLSCAGSNTITAGCSGFGPLLARPAEVPVRAPDAFQLESRACNSGALNACVDLGGMQLAGLGTDRAPDNARASFERACDGGELAGCGELGSVYAMGLGVEPDKPRGQTLFERACGSGELDACANVEGNDARGSYRKLCDDEHLAGGCIALGADLLQVADDPKSRERGSGYLDRAARGEGLDRAEPYAYAILASYERDKAKAAALNQQACTLGVWSGCSAYGVALIRGDGVPKNETNGESFFQKGCDAHDVTSCAQLAIYSWTRHEPLSATKALEELQNACMNGGIAFACAIGSDFAKAGAKEVPPDAERARLLRDRACALGVKDACAAAQKPAAPQPGRCPEADYFRHTCAVQDCSALMQLKGEMSADKLNDCIDYCSSPTDRVKIAHRRFPSCH